MRWPRSSSAVNAGAFRPTGTTVGLVIRYGSVRVDGLERRRARRSRPQYTRRFRRSGRATIEHHLAGSALPNHRPRRAPSGIGRADGVEETDELRNFSRA